jgi:phosphoribosylamine--glycine ligase
VLEARELAYQGVENVRWEGVEYRRDIAHRAIARERDQAAQAKARGT